jgi:hypothetical protein
MALEVGAAGFGNIVDTINQGALPEWFTHMQVATGGHRVLDVFLQCVRGQRNDRGWCPPVLEFPVASSPSITGI